MNNKTVRFGRYVLERRLAIGGMAEVLVAHFEGPEGFAKKVVIKRMLPHLLHNESFLHMFLDEARLAAKFNHPNLVQVYELTKIDDQFCLIMEYIEGDDVASILDKCLSKNTIIPIEIAASIVSFAAEGLHYAHELTQDDGRQLNVVHRDISPANIIVTWRGGVKVVDFGIAKHDISQTETAVGMLKGKFSYMSPEQASGGAVDRRSDIFSLAIVLYELLTLTPCFTGPHQYEVLESVTKVRCKPPKELRADIPATLERILRKMLHKNPADRYQEAQDVARDLQRFMAQSTMATSTDLAEFLRHLYGRPTQKRRVPTATREEQQVPVRDELEAPEITVDENSYHNALRRYTQNIEKSQSRRDTEQESPRFSQEISESKLPTDDAASASLEDFLVFNSQQMASLTSQRSKRFSWVGWSLVVSALLGGGGLIYTMTTKNQKNDKPVEVMVDKPVSDKKNPKETAAPVKLPNLTIPEPPIEEPKPEVKPVEQPVVPEPTPTPNPPTPKPLSKPIPRNGYLNLDSEPAMDVMIDNKPVGSTPLSRIELPPGTVTISMRNNELGLSKLLRVVIPDNATVTKRVTMRKGQVVFDIKPWAHVFFQNKKLGTTPMPPLSLYEGTYNFKLVNSDLNVEKIFKVTIKADKLKKVSENLNE